MYMVSTEVVFIVILRIAPFQHILLFGLHMYAMFGHLANGLSLQLTKTQVFLYDWPCSLEGLLKHADTEARTTLSK